MTLLEAGYKGRPMYRGLPVPYVARWSGEVLNIPYTPVPVMDENWMWPNLLMNGRLVPRDKHGVFWAPENPGYLGEPDFGQVSSRRQKTSMLRRKCQVCGMRLPTGPTLYLLPWAEWGLPTDGDGKSPFKNSTPPICAECAEYSPQICPALTRMGARLISVTKSMYWGVFGEWVKIVVHGDQLALERGKGDVPLSPQLRATMGKQAIIEVQEFETVRTWGG